MNEEKFEMPSIEEVETMLTDPDLCGASEIEMPIGKVLLFSAFVGEEDAALAKATGMPLQLVFEVTKILIKNGVFGRDLDHYKDYFEDKKGSIALNCDLACGKNMLQRSERDGVAVWKMTEEGTKYVEQKLLPQSKAAQKLTEDVLESHGVPRSSWRKQ